MRRKHEIGKLRPIQTNADNYWWLTDGYGVYEHMYIQIGSEVFSVEQLTQDNLKREHPQKNLRRLVFEKMGKDTFISFDTLESLHMAHRWSTGIVSACRRGDWRYYGSWDEIPLGYRVVVIS
jgi:hypothetical protein